MTGIFKFIFNFSLRNGIESNAVNWKNCTMYVQDINFPGTNIVAEIPENEAYNFQKLCSEFAKFDINFIDKYVSHLSSIQSANKVNGSNAESTSTNATNAIVGRVINSSAQIKARIESPKSSSPSNYARTLDNESEKLSSGQINTYQAGEKIIQNRIDFHIVCNRILEENKMLIENKVQAHQHFKTEITSILTGYVKSINSTLDVVPFGSNQYNLGEAGSNFNLFIFTGTIFLKNNYNKFK